jgi:hypothetical protein
MAHDTRTPDMLDFTPGIGDHPVAGQELYRLLAHILDDHMVGMKPHTSGWIRLFGKKFRRYTNAHTIGHHIAASTHTDAVTGASSTRFRNNL